MAIHLVCVCGQQYAVKDEFAGQQVKCPLCLRVLAVTLAPRPSSTPPLPVPAPRGGGNVALVIASCLVLLMVGAAAAVLLNLDRLNEMLGDPEQKADAGKKTEAPPPPQDPPPQVLPPPRPEPKRTPTAPTTPPKKPEEPKQPPEPKPTRPPDDNPPPRPKPGQRPFEGHTAPVLGVAFSRDGKRSLSGSGGFAEDDGRFSVLLDNSLCLWDAATGLPLKRVRGFRNGIAAVAFSADGRRALVASAGKITNRIWTPGGDFDLRLWDIDAGRELRVLEGHRSDILCLAFSGDGRLALSGGRDKIVRMWKVQTGEETQRLVGHTDTVNSVAFTPDGLHALSAGSDRTVRLWELKRGTEVRQFEGHKDIVWAVAVSPDGRLALSGGGYQPRPGGRGLVPGNKDYALRLWDIATGKEVRRFEGHTEAVSQVTFSPDGKRVLSCGADRSVRLWLTDSGRELRRFTGHKKLVFTVAFSADGRRALSGGADAELRLWELPADIPELVKRLRGADGPARLKAAEELGLYGESARTALPDLLAVLQGADADLRRSVLSSLERIGRPLPEHAALLILLVKTGTQADIRAYALGALAALGADARPAVAVLGEVLKDSDPTVRVRAAAALGQVGPRARTVTYPLLVAALRDSEASVVTAAEEALAKLGPPGKGKVTALAALLKDSAEPVRRHALNALGELKGDAEPAAAAVAAVAAQDGSAALRRLAVKTLVEVRPAGKESLAVFSKALADTDAAVARQAATALARVGAEGGALPALLRALGHADAEVVRTANAAFEKVAWSKTHAATLAAALGTARPALRARFIGVLAKLGADAADAVPALCELLAKADAKERMEVVATLGKIGLAARAAGPDLVPLLKRDPKEKGKDLPARLEVAFVLAAIEAKEIARAIPVLVSGLRIENDEEESLAQRERVARALVRIGKPAAEPLAVALHGQFLIGNPNTPAGVVRAAARLKVIQVLAEMGPKKAGANEVLRLLAKLEGQEPFIVVRKAARTTRMALQKQ